MKKLISWNVNGLRACVGKNFMDFFREVDADVFAIQESKLQEGQIQMNLPGYHQYWNYAEKKGYSGTAVFTKEEPISVSYGIGIEEHDHEGRVITLEYPDFYFVTCYTPTRRTAGTPSVPYGVGGCFPGLPKRAGEPEDASGRYAGSGDSLR